MPAMLGNLPYISGRTCISYIFGVSLIFLVNRAHIQLYTFRYLRFLEEEEEEEKEKEIIFCHNKSNRT